MYQRNSIYLYLCFFGPALLIGVVASCQNAKAPEYKPNELQALKLQVKQKDAQLKRIEFNRAQQDFQASYAALMDEVATIKKENKWPDNLLFDPDKLQFSEPPKPMPNASSAPSPGAPTAPAPGAAPAQPRTPKK